MIYYINNCERGNPDILDERISCVSPTDFLTLNEINESDSLVIPCELEVTSQNETVKRTDFYGISFAQDLRRRDYKNKILFVSFLPKRYYKENVINSKILFFSGHSFMQLPESSAKWIDKLETFDPLSDLSLYDVKHHYCGIKQIIDTQFHSLTPKFIASKKLTPTLINEGQELLKWVYNGLNRPIPKTDDFLNTTISGKKALTTLKSLCETVLPETLTLKNNKLQPEWGNWKILWLDDEGNKESPLYKELVFRLGSNQRVILCNTYERAIEEWNADKAYGEIALVICDYRLKQKDGFPAPKQGYDFMKHLAETGANVGKIAYSGLKRKFLIESFRHYGIQVNIYSKIDFNQYSKNDLAFISDEIIRLGDNHWIEINNAPQASEWSLIAPTYHKFKNGVLFYTFQNYISRLAAQNLEVFFEEFNKQSTREGIWNLTFTDSFKVRTGYFPNGIDKKTEAIKEILTTRRFAIGLYAFLRSSKNKQTSLLSPENYLDYIKVILYNSASNGKGYLIEEAFNDDFYSKIKTHSTLKLILKFNAIVFDSSWPLGLLPEELGWLKFDLDLIPETQNEIHSFLHQIQILKKNFQVLFSQKPFMDMISKKDGTLKTSARLIHFNDHNCPIIRNSSEAKSLIQTIYDTIDIDDLETNSIFLSFWRGLISQLTKGNFKSSGQLSDFLYFATKTLSAKKIDFAKISSVQVSSEIQTVLPLLESLLAVAQRVHENPEGITDLSSSNLVELLKLKKISTYNRNLIKTLLNNIQNTNDLDKVLVFLPTLIQNLNENDCEGYISSLQSSSFCVSDIKYSIELEYILKHKPWEILFTKKQRIHVNFEEISNELLGAVIQKNFNYQNKCLENQNSIFSNALADIINIYHDNNVDQKNEKIYLRAIQYINSRSLQNSEFRLINRNEKRLYDNELSTIDYAERQLAQKNFQEQIEYCNSLLDFEQELSIEDDYDLF